MIKRVGGTPVCMVVAVAGGNGMPGADSGGDGRLRGGGAGPRSRRPWAPVGIYRFRRARFTDHLSLTHFR